jgi:hypothetical protein
MICENLEYPGKFHLTFEAEAMFRKRADNMFFYDLQGNYTFFSSA